jgi:hypothetical protein
MTKSGKIHVRDILSSVSILFFYAELLEHAIAQPKPEDIWTGFRFTKKVYDIWEKCQEQWGYSWLVMVRRSMEISKLQLNSFSDETL